MKTIFILGALSALSANAGLFQCKATIEPYEPCLAQEFRVSADTSNQAYRLQIYYRFVAGAQFCDGPTRRPSYLAEGELVPAIGGFKLTNTPNISFAYLEMDGDTPSALSLRINGPGAFVQRIPLDCDYLEE